MRFQLNRKFSVIIVYLVFLFLLFGLGSIAITTIIRQLVDLVENAPDYILQVNRLLLEWSSDLEYAMADLPDEFVQEVNSSINSSVDSLTDLLRTNIRVERFATLVAVIPNYIVSFIVYLIALFLFMLELPHLKTKMYQNFTDETSEKIQFMFSRLKYVIVGFLKAQFLVSIIILFVSMIGLLIIIPEYAVIMATIIWLVDLIPIVGSIAVLGPWAIYMLIANHYLMGIQLGVLAIVLLTIRRTVEPKVMGQHIGLSPLATLIAMYVGLQLIGILGFIAGPIVVIAFNSAKEAGIIKWNFKI